MSDSDEEYYTAEESDDDMPPVPTSPDTLSPILPGFVVWTSEDGTVWYLPHCEPDTVP